MVWLVIRFGSIFVQNFFKSLKLFYVCYFIVYFLFFQRESYYGFDIYGVLVIVQELVLIFFFGYVVIYVVMQLSFSYVGDGWVG